MTISHHLDPANLLSMAAGTLSQSHTVVAEAHLEVCSHCRAALRVADTVAGNDMVEEVSALVSSNVKNKVMAQLTTATLLRFPKPTQPDGELPRSLRRLTGLQNLSDVRWRRSAPGIDVAKLAKPQGERGFFGLLRIQPGMAVPEHGHGGTELTLILSGAYHDEMGHFGPGDIADHDESISHQPVTVGNEPCICLVANEAPTAFRSWIARLIQPMIGI